MKPETFLVLSFIVLLILGNVMGWLINDVYSYYSNKRVFDGLQIRNMENHSDVLQAAKGYDKLGDWVCVNVKGISYPRALQVCQHEVAHEIFATFCAKDNNIDICMNITTP